MAFNFDYTPLGAVGRLAMKAGRAKSNAATAAQMVSMRGQNIARQQVRATNEARKTQNDRGFQLQLAASNRADRAQAMSERSMRGSNRGYSSQRADKDAMMKDWESLESSMSRPEYVRGMISIRGGQVPRQLAAAGNAVKSAMTSLRDEQYLASQMGNYTETMAGYTRQSDGSWVEKSEVGWKYNPLGASGKVTDAKQNAKLNEAYQGSLRIGSFVKGQIAQQEGATQANMSPEQRVNTAANQWLSTQSRDQSQAISALQVDEVSKITGKVVRPAMTLAEIFLKEMEDKQFLAQQAANKRKYDNRWNVSQHANFGMGI